MTFGSLFSGVGGIDLGLERAGMRCAWQCEIDPQARSVLRRHWPDVPLHEDVRNVGRSNLAPVDVVCGGFPCQDLSVAGRRAGLAGERSGLWHEFHRVLSEIRPRWVLIENVPGLLSSNGGRDLSVLLGGLADLGYWWTYRVLDSRYFGVPQRRRRVFIVGHLGAPCPPEVLLEPESLPGDPAPCAEAWAGVAGAVTRRFGGTGADDNDARGGRVVATALRSRDAKGSPDSDCTQTPVAFNPTAGTRDVQAGPLSPPLRVGSGEDGKGSSEQQVVVPVQEVGKRTGKSTDDPRAGIGIGEAGDPMYSLQAGAQHGVIAHGPAVAFQHKASSHQSMNPNELAPALDRVGTVPRRLTPVECERLQSWPPGWTAWGVDEDGNRVEMADGPRYRMAGNGVTSSVAEWIGRRIIEAGARLVPESDPREGV